MFSTSKKSSGILGLAGKPDKPFGASTRNAIRENAEANDEVVLFQPYKDDRKKEDEPYSPKFAALLNSGYELGSVVEIEIDRLDDNPVNSRYSYPASLIDERAAEIEAQGQLQAIDVVLSPDAPGRFVIAEGHCRKRAMQKLGRTTIKAVIHDIRDKGELYLFAYRSNTSRDNQYDIDDGLAWDNLLLTGVYASQQDLAAAIGIDDSSISRTINAYKEVPESLMGLYKEHPDKFTMNFASEFNQICRGAGLEKAIEVANQHILKSITYRDLQALRKQLLSTPAKQKVATANSSYEIKAGDITAATVTVRKNGSFAVESATKGISSQKLESLRKGIEELVQKVMAE